MVGWREVYIGEFLRGGDKVAFNGGGALGLPKDN